LDTAGEINARTAGFVGSGTAEHAFGEQGQIALVDRCCRFRSGVAAGDAEGFGRAAIHDLEERREDGQRLQFASHPGCQHEGVIDLTSRGKPGAFVDFGGQRRQHDVAKARHRDGTEPVGRVGLPGPVALRPLLMLHRLIVHVAHDLKIARFDPGDPVGLAHPERGHSGITERMIGVLRADRGVAGDDPDLLIGGEHCAGIAAESAGLPVECAPIRPAGIGIRMQQRRGELLQPAILLDQFLAKTRSSQRGREDVVGLVGAQIDRQPPLGHGQDRADVLGEAGLRLGKERFRRGRVGAAGRQYHHPARVGVAHRQHLWHVGHLAVARPQ